MSHTSLTDVYRYISLVVFLIPRWGLKGGGFFLLVPLVLCFAGDPEHASPSFFFSELDRIGQLGLARREGNQSATAQLACLYPGTRRTLQTPIVSYSSHSDRVRASCF